MFPQGITGGNIEVASRVAVTTMMASAAVRGGVKRGE